MDTFSLYEALGIGPTEVEGGGGGLPSSLRGRGPSTRYTLSSPAPSVATASPSSSTLRGGLTPLPHAHYTDASMFSPFDSKALSETDLEESLAAEARINRLLFHNASSPSSSIGGSGALPPPVTSLAGGPSAGAFSDRDGRGGTVRGSASRRGGRSTRNGRVSAAALQPPSRDGGRYDRRVIIREDSSIAPLDLPDVKSETIRRERLAQGGTSSSSFSSSLSSSSSYATQPLAFNPFRPSAPSMVANLLTRESLLGKRSEQVASGTARSPSLFG